MKWETEPEPKHGDFREIEEFLFFPETLPNVVYQPTRGYFTKSVTRWWEWARIRQVYVESLLSSGWVDVCWCDL